MAETIDGDCTSAAVILSRSTQHAANAASAMAAAEIRSAPTRSLRRRDGLIQFARDETSQNGEDGVIAAIFACLDKRQRPKTRWCVDVGAWDGRHLSNTYSLLVPGGAGDGGDDTLSPGLSRVSTSTGTKSPVQSEDQSTLSRVSTSTGTKSPVQSERYSVHTVHTYIIHIIPYV